MIPATLPAATCAPAPGADAGRARTAPDDRFEQVLDHATRRGDAPRDPATETRGRSTDEPDERRTDGSDHRDDAPGAHGHEQALAAMPADVPARVVLNGTAHDARVLAGTDAATSPEAATEPLAPAVDGDAAGGDPVVGADLALGLDVAETAEPVQAPDAAAPTDDDVSAPAGADAGIDPGIEGPGEGEPADAMPVGEEASAPRPEASRPGMPSAPADNEGADDQDGAPSLRGADPSAGRAADAPGRDVQAARAARPSTPAPDVTAHLENTAPTTGPSTPAASAPAATAAPAAAPAAPPVAQQLVGHVTPLLAGPDGTHELTIELRPAELGTVRLEVLLDDGVLSVRLHADDPASRRLLAQSLGDLRSALADAGIDAGSLDVGDPRNGATADERDRGTDRPPAPPSDATAPTPARPARPVTPSSAAVDVLL